MSRSISIINTEVQLINVIEAIHKFGCKDNYLIIGQFNIQPNRIQKIEKMLAEPMFRKHFKRIIHLPLYLSNKNFFRFLAYFLAYIKFFLLVVCSKNFDYCFFGVVTDIIVKPVAFLVQNRNPKSMLCVIDEGVRIIADSAERVKNKHMLTQKKTTCNRLLTGYFKAITKNWIYPSLTYFSIYELSLLPQDNLIKNDFSFFRKNKISSIKLEQNAIIIVGQPFVELQIISKETYEKIILQITRMHIGCNIYYAPHPIETQFYNWLPQNIKILKSQYPLELVLISNSISEIIGFNSSVLFNSTFLNICDKIFSILLDESYLLDSRLKGKNAEIYAHFKKVGVNVVTIDSYYKFSFLKEK